MFTIRKVVVSILFFTWTLNCVTGDKNKLPFLAYLDLVGNSNSFFVSQITPGSGTSNIPLNTSIQVTFNAAFDSATITSSTFILHKNGVPIQANLTLSETSAVLTPNANLSSSTTYTVEIKKDIQSTTGKSLKEDLTWNFTTSALVDAVAPMLSLRTPSIGASLVPDNTSIQIAFSETVDCTTVDNSTFILKNDATLVIEPSTVNCFGSNATLVPNNPLLPNTTYRVNVLSFISDLANNPILPQTWTFTTGAGPDSTPPSLSFSSPGPGATAVSVNTGISVAFSETIQCGTIAGNLTLDDNPMLPGLVAVNVSCSGTTASIVPTAALSYNTTYTVNVSNGITDLANNPTANTSWTFTTGTAPDSTAPTVTFTVPTNNAVGIGINTIPSAVFSEPMLCASVNTASFRLKVQATGVYLLGSVNCFGTSATWTPNAVNPLSYNTTYTVEVNAGALDKANNPIVPISWDFTTGAGPDLTPPNVSFVTPTNGAAGISVNTGISIAFDETMSCGSILGLGSITLDDDPLTPATTIPLNITCNGNTVALSPTAALAYNTTYTAKISTAVTDAANNSIAPYTWSFTTGAAPDLIPPQVSLVSPSSGATNVAVNSNITVAFNETVDCSTVNFTINNGIGGTVNCSGASATFVPNVATPLNAGTTYTATIGAVKDIASNSMVAVPYTWNFTTGLGPDVTAPTVTIQNLRNNSVVESGFVIGTSNDDRSVALVEISIDSGAYAPATGTTNWKFQLPIGNTTWKSNSQHTIQVRIKDTSNNVATSPLITVRKGTNRDINGDGYTDLVAPEYGQGLVYIFHSSGSAGITIPSAQFASKIIVGTAASQFGKTVTMGDLNGDGYADVIVGAPKFQSAGTNNGRVYIFYSSGTIGITPTLAAFANNTLTGTNGTNDRFGDTLTTGDINGDGYTDVVVGAPSYNGSMGRIYVFHSAGATGIANVTVTGAGAGASSFKTGAAANERFGFSLASGNINGGNEDDIAVGAPGFNSGSGVDWGRIYMYYGSGAGLTAAVNTLTNNTGNPAVAGPGGAAQYGYTVAVADVSGDGYADVIAGAPFFIQVGNPNLNQQGRVTVFNSAGAGGVANANIGAAIRVYTGINAINGQFLGITLAVKDLDLDGRADVIIVSAAPGPNTVYVYMNSAASAAIRDTTAADVTMVTGALYGVNSLINGPGIPLAISDVNGDGLPDMLINGSETVRIYHSVGGATPITNNPAGANYVILGSALGGGIGGAASNSNEFGSGLY
ncbi:Ig-like domain-containing protein [Leptospira kmetyi]|uniref:Ig-like domain-containing protein n=1 Tax=Leptospira kmetyi TaxID=408139 RepID=UPI003EB90709